MQDDDDVQISFDTAKSERNLRERGFDFVYAAQVFDDLLFQQVDNRRNYGEERIRAFGFINGKPYLVVYTSRINIRHIISACRCREKYIRRLLASTRRSKQGKSDHDRDDNDNVPGPAAQGPRGPGGS